MWAGATKIRLQTTTSESRSHLRLSLVAILQSCNLALFTVFLGRDGILYIYMKTNSDKIAPTIFL